MFKSISNLVGCLALSAVVAVSNASAVTFDFVALAAGNEHGAVSEAFNNGPLTVTASGHSLDGTQQYLMYLDDLSGGAPGGMGVCQGLTFPGGECADGADDNIGLYEVLVLSFNTLVEITDITFSNGEHIDEYNGFFGVAIDSNPTTTAGFTQIAQTAAYSGSLIGTTFSFISNSSFAGGGGLKDVNYISSITANPVPEPFTLGLLGLGVVPLARRRFRRTEA